MFKAIFFDLDETLINAFQAHRNANNEAFAHFGFDYEKDIRPQIGSRSFRGMRMNEILDKMLDQLDLHKTIDKTALQKIRRNLFVSSATDHATLLPGAKQALQHAKNHANHVTIASSSNKAFIEAIIDKFDLDQLIDNTIGLEDVSKGKPDPEMYELARKHTEYDNHECLVIEDSVNGVVSAQRGGFPVLHVPFHLDPQEVDSADWTLESLEDFDLHKLT